MSGCQRSRAPGTQSALPFRSMRQQTSWSDQAARILRWRERVRKSRDEGRTDALGTEGYRDEVFALFQAIWHFKDWIKSDPRVDNALARSIESWISSRADFLKVAADVANGSKHMALSAGRAGDSAQTRNDVHILAGAGTGGGVVKHTFYITDRRSDSDHEAVALADLCIEEWREFLTENGLEWPNA